MAAEEVIEEVADHIEDVAEVTRSITGRDMGLVFFGSCVGTVGGIAIGYFLAKTKLEAKYEQEAKQDIADLREHFRQKLQAAEPKPPIKQMVEDLGYSRTEEKEEVEEDDSDKVEPVVEVTNVFDNPDADVSDPEESEPDAPEWDYTVEVKSRDSHHPYVIHVDEYKKHESGYDQVTYAYYEDDDVLANDRDGVVDTTQQDGLVPPDFATKFGHGSDDPNIVYVRCDEYAVEIEIVRNDGNYGEVVHGFLKHSDERGRRHKPHFDDD